MVLSTGDYAFIYECGYSKPTSSITMETRHEFVKCIILHYCTFSCYAESNQLKSGLVGVLGMDEIAKNYPVELWSLLASDRSAKITAQYLQDLFEVIYHPLGHNNWPSEERSIMFLYIFCAVCVYLLPDPSYLQCYSDIREVQR